MGKKTAQDLIRAKIETKKTLEGEPLLDGSDESLVKVFHDVFRSLSELYEQIWVSDKFKGDKRREVLSKLYKTEGKLRTVYDEDISLTEDK